MAHRVAPAPPVPCNQAATRAPGRTASRALGLALGWGLGLALGTAVGSGLAGCAADRPRPIRPADDLRDPNPSRRLTAVSECARTRDLSQLELLIELLDDDDEGVRLLAGRTLEDLTGRSTGYRAFAEAPERRAQVEEWRRWLASAEGQAARQRLRAPGGAGR